MNTSNNSVHRFRTQRMVVAGSAVLLASGFGNGLNYLFGIFLARSLGADQFGLYALGFTFFTTLSMVVPLGIDAGAIKFISEYKTNHDQEGVRRVILQAGGITFLTAVFAALSLAGFASTISESLYHKAELTRLLIYFAAAIPIYAVTGVFLTALQALQTVRPLILVRYMWEPMGKFTLASLAVWAGWGISGVLAAILITLVAGLALTIQLLQSSIPLRCQSFKFWRGSEATRLVRYCFPLGIAVLLGVVVPRTDMFILGSWAGVREIGIYQAAFQTASVLALVLGALETSLTPFFGQMHAQQDMSGLQHMYQTASKIVLIFTVPLFVLLAIFNGEVLSLFGDEFRAGGMLLMILAAGQLLSSAGGSPNNLLLMGGRSRLVMWNTIGIGIVALCLFAFAIPRWGILGAAIVAAGAQALGVGLRILQVWQIYHIQPFQPTLAKPILAGLGAALGALAIKPYVPPPLLLGLGCLTAFVYIALLFALKLDEQDHQALSTLIGKTRMVLTTRA